MIFWIFVLLFIQNTCGQIDNILLNTTNNIIIRGEINEKTTSHFIYNLNLMKNKNNTYVYLNTPGGSVEEGMKIVSEIKQHNLSCIAERAYSMGFIIFQACKERLILPHGKLMQHQMALGIMDQKNRIKNYLRFIESMEDEIIEQQISRINITKEEFTRNINDDWWLYANNAISENCADKIVNIECSRSLTKETEIKENGFTKIFFSKCSLVSHPIKIHHEKNNIFFNPFV